MHFFMKTKHKHMFIVSVLLFITKVPAEPRRSSVAVSPTLLTSNSSTVLTLPPSLHSEGAARQTDGQLCKNVCCRYLVGSRGVFFFSFVISVDFSFY